MQPLRVITLTSQDERAGLLVYTSEKAEPTNLGIAEGGDSGVLYDPLLDLGAANWQESPATALFVVGIELEAGHEDDFEGWYNTEHLPALAEVPGVNRAVRYRKAPGQDQATDYPEFLALYDVVSLDIPGNADWVAAVETPWTQRLRPHFTAPWRGGYRLTSS